MRYLLAGATDRGAVRDHNEDAVDWIDGGDWALALVADGMGGYSGGEVASSLCVELFAGGVRKGIEARLGKAVERWSPRQIQALLREVGGGVHRRIKQEQRRQPRLSRMGTTLVAGLVWGDRICVIHAGDSRCYRLRGEQLALLTRDHTYVAELLARGGLDSKALRNHPLRHVVTRALGGREDFEFALNTQRVAAGDVYLFCSDGLSNSLSARALKRSLSAGAAPVTITVSLIAQAKPKAQDNVSAVVVSVGA